MANVAPTAINGSVITITMTTAANVSANVQGASANMINIAVLEKGGANSLKSLSDVLANTAQSGYVLTVNTNGTSNTSDDTYYFNNPTSSSVDGGSF